MKKSVIIAIIASLSAGCASAAPKGATRPPRPEQEVRLEPAVSAVVRAESASPAKRLAQAIELLRMGEKSAAARTLASVTNGRPVPGVTDEALFRLALLSLRRGGERGGGGQGQQLLRRLKREYPASPWTAQAAPLTEMLSGVDELRRQNRALATANQTLTAERNELRKKVDELDDRIKQLNKNLDKLKNLDLELEQKSR